MLFSTRAYHVCKAVQREEIVMRYILQRAVGVLKAETSRIELNAIHER
jgi:hypothetical protein